MTRYLICCMTAIVIGILAGCNSGTTPQNTTINGTEPTAPTETSAVVAVDEDAIRREIDSMTEEEYRSGFTASIEAWTKESPVKIDKFEVDVEKNDLLVNEWANQMMYQNVTVWVDLYVDEEEVTKDDDALLKELKQGISFALDEEEYGKRKIYEIIMRFHDNQYGLIFHESRRTYGSGYLDVQRGINLVEETEEERYTRGLIYDYLMDYNEECFSDEVYMSGDHGNVTLAQFGILDETSTLFVEIKVYSNDIEKDAEAFKKELLGRGEEIEQILRSDARASEYFENNGVADIDICFNIPWDTKGILRKSDVEEEDIPWYEMSPYDHLPKGTNAGELFGTHHFSTENDFEYIPPSVEQMKGNAPKELISSHYHVSLPNNLHHEFVDIIAQIDEDTYVNVTDLIEWNVEDDTVAYVYDGRIMANEKGSTVVTASFAGFEVSIDVVVETTEDFESVLLNDSEHEVLGTWSADLTHDDNEELVMISQGDSEYIFEIYMMIDGTPTVIYQDRASNNHAGWRWYYLMEIDGKNYLLQYVPEIWNGIGEYRYVFFSFDQNGQKAVFESHELSYDSVHISEEEKTELSEKLEAFRADYETWQSRGIPLLTVGSDPLTGIVYHSVMEKESTSKY